MKSLASSNFCPYFVANFLNNKSLTKITKFYVSGQLFIDYNMGEFERGDQNFLLKPYVQI